MAPGEDEADACTGLLVHGFSKAGEPHLVEDPLDAPSIWPSRRPMTIVPPSAFAKAVRAEPRSLGKIRTLLRANHWSSGSASKAAPVSSAGSARAAST